MPALRCLLAIQQLDPEHPKSHELSSRLRHALGNLKEPLPETAHSVVKETFLSKASTSSVADANEEYFSAHKTSAPHVQSIVNVRLALKPTLEIKAKSAEDLQATLPTSTLQEAIDGLHVLETIGADKDAREAYSRKAVERWSEADVFRV